MTIQLAIGIGNTIEIVSQIDEANRTLEVPNRPPMGSQGTNTVLTFRLFQALIREC
jgi:hypothetical protein